MANDTSGPDATPQREEPGRPDQDSETTFYARPDVQPPAANHTPQPAANGTTAVHGTAPGPGGYGPGQGATAAYGTGNAGYGPPQIPYAPPPAGYPGGGQVGAAQYGGAPGGQYSGGGSGAYPAVAPRPQQVNPYGPPPHRSAGAPSKGGGRRGLLGIAAVGLVAALLGGGVGGAVGATLAGGQEPAPAAPTSGDSLREPLPGADPSGTPLGPVEAVAQRVLPSVVQLLVDSPAGGSSGSGMVLSADGLMLTNNHVVEGAASGGTITVVFHDGTTAPAQIVGLDPSSDLAVIQSQGATGLTPIELGDSEAVQVGEQVVAFGSPLGLGGTVTTGIISAVDRAVSVGPESGATSATVLNALQTDAPINPGNSGGPLVDLQGRVVGINSVIATTGEQGGSIGVGFAIPVNQARRIAEELQATGQAQRAVLGVSLPPDDPRSLSGAVIGQVSPGGPAEAAGLQPGEVVTRVDDRVITGSDELVAAIRDRAPGDQVTLTVNGRSVVVTLAGETG